MASDKPDTKGCETDGFWNKALQYVGLADSTCNAKIDAAKPKDTAQDHLPDLLIEGVEAAKRQHATGTINKQEAEMLKDT
ncbi:MAG: hypothetical protein ACRD3W_21855 [Terriglobales bacterium]